VLQKHAKLIIRDHDDCVRGSSPQRMNAIVALIR
jgi:hypothetical protein